MSCSPVQPRCHSLVPVKNPQQTCPALQKTLPCYNLSRRGTLLASSRFVLNISPPDMLAPLHMPIWYFSSVEPISKCNRFFRVLGSRCSGPAADCLHHSRQCIPVAQAAYLDLRCTRAGTTVTRLCWPVHLLYLQKSIRACAVPSST
jgi:hypothetical protein